MSLLAHIWPKSFRFHPLSPRFWVVRRSPPALPPNFSTDSSRVSVAFLELPHVSINSNGVSVCHSSSSTFPSCWGLCFPSPFSPTIFAFCICIVTAFHAFHSPVVTSFHQIGHNARQAWPVGAGVCWSASFRRSPPPPPLPRKCKLSGPLQSTPRISTNTRPNASKPHCLRQSAFEQ